MHLVARRQHVCKVCGAVLRQFMFIPSRDGTCHPNWKLSFWPGHRGLGRKSVALMGTCQRCSCVSRYLLAIGRRSESMGEQIPLQAGHVANRKRPGLAGLTRAQGQLNERRVGGVPDLCTWRTGDFKLYLSVYPEPAPTHFSALRYIHNIFVILYYIHPSSTTYYICELEQRKITQ